MSGLVVFTLKYPSLLPFDIQTRQGPDTTVGHNLRTLYGVARAPSDTCLHKRLDVIDPRSVRRRFTTFLASLFRGKGLEGFTTFDGHYRVSINGTPFFQFDTIHCDHCRPRPHRDGTMSCSHPMLARALMHPDCKTVFSGSGDDRS